MHKQHIECTFIDTISIKKYLKIINYLAMIFLYIFYALTFLPSTRSIHIIVSSNNVISIAKMSVHVYKDCVCITSQTALSIQLGDFWNMTFIKVKYKDHSISIKFKNHLQPNLFIYNPGNQKTRLVVLIAHTAFCALPKQFKPGYCTPTNQCTYEFKAVYLV